MTYNVLSPDNADPVAVEILKDAGFNVQAGDIKRDAVMATIANVDAMLIRSATKADAELLNAATNLKVIARAGVGVDNVDLATATARGIVVMNTPDGNTIATAEHTFALMLALARQIPTADASMRAGRWDRKLFMGTELRGKRLGIVGFGRIGRAVAKRALAFEMIVEAYDPYIPEDVAKDLGVNLISLDILYRDSDFITLHSLINDDTREMIRAENIAKMKDGVRIINAARGALINEADLAEALKSGKVGGAGLDVFQKEPPDADNPLLNLPNVVYTPHLAASTADAQVQVGIDAAREIVEALTRGDYNNVCNPAVLETLKN